MAIEFRPGQVAVGDMSPTGPTPLSNVKRMMTKVIKLSSANFSTGNTDTLVAVLPADATILGMRQWVRTQLAGGSVSAATVSIGSASGGTQFASALSVFGTAGTNALLSPITGIVQNYAIPQGGDINIWVRGTATGGNPTSGEIYLIIDYTR